MRPADPPALRLAVACGRVAAHAEFRGEHGLAAGLAEIARVLAAKAEADTAALSEHPGMVREQNAPPARRG
jgi:hypothetical protein